MRRIGLLFVAVIAMLLSGCNLTLHPAPKEDSIPFEPIKEFSSTNSVTLVNGQPSTEDVRIGTSGSNTIAANYNGWTGTAMEIAARELRKRGLKVVPGAARTITMSIERVHSELGTFTLRSEIVMKVTTNGGYSKVYTVEHDSSTENLYRLMSVATARVVQEMFMDPQIVTFLTH